MAGYIGSAASVVSSGAERKKTFTITGATTSLTGLNYTVGKVHVFQNGVRLVDGTDYTATNGTTITLTAAAQNGDNVVVISQASYQVALSGIDDQSNATAITIDSNENVLVGTTSFAGSFNDPAGIYLSGQYDYLQAIRSGGAAAGFSRNSSDGAILNFGKDGTTVGSIGAKSGDIYIGTGDTGVRFNDGDNAVYAANTTTGGASDGNISLGVSAARFKDLYLSGGVYLGGTGSANKLDDYETGTFTPNVDTGSIDIAEGAYVKVGDLVHCTLTVGHSMNASSSSPIQFNGLPFTSSNASDGSHGTVFCRYVNNFPNAVQVMTSNTRIRLWASGSTAFSTINHNNITSATYALFYIGLTYRAA